jgi:carbamoyltransferase
MKILGIHDGHGASACLLEEGVIKYVIQEERLTNVKNESGFPFKSIERILKISGLTTDDIDYVAMASKYVAARPDNRTELIELYKKSASYRGKINHFLMQTPMYPIYKKFKSEDRVKNLKKIGIEESNVIFFDHHLCHASAAYFGSPWHDDPVLVLTNDGAGDGICSTVYIGESGELNKIAETPRGNSLGHIYEWATFMMGFMPGEHEYKIMGMAPYASKDGVQKVYNVFDRYLKLDRSGLTFKRGVPEPTHLMYSRFKRELELLRFDWIAGGLQKKTEDILVEWIRNCIKKTDIHKVALGGGVFMNVKANKRIMEIPEVESLFVFPSCGDDSLSIGAAYYLYSKKCRENDEVPAIPPLKEIYLGDSFSDDQVEDVIKANIDEFRFEYEYIEDIEKRISELLVEGEIVARCKGRMEYGARALGNRSILADASDLGCVRTINMMIKNRDFWMPFAPVILKDREKDYIINPKNIPAPYMIMSFDTTDKREDFLAAIHQSDLTARPQIIEKEWNHEYYKILKEFERVTERGVLLNTSFNLHGYPIVHGPKEAIWTFKNSGLEYLTLGNYLLYKKEKI